MNFLLAVFKSVYVWKSIWACSSVFRLFKFEIIFCKNEKSNEGTINSGMSLRCASTSHYRVKGETKIPRTGNGHANLRKLWQRNVWKNSATLTAPAKVISTGWNFHSISNTFFLMHECGYCHVCVDVASRVSESVEKNRHQLQRVSDRIRLAQARVDKIKGSKKATKVTKTKLQVLYLDSCSSITKNP